MQRDLILTDEQEILIEKIKRWFIDPNKSKMYFSYTGKGGTGKTSILPYLLDELNLSFSEFTTCCYTGKGALVLTNKGLPSSTIHSLIYLTYSKKVTDPVTHITKNKLVSVLKTELDPNLKLIIVDEATMVNDTMRDQLLSFGIPIIFIGDNNQLPPIFGISSVMQNPDFALTKIMRQEEDNPIIYMADSILNDEPLYLGNYGDSRIITSHSIDASLLTDYDIIICAKNIMREEINTEIRHNVLGAQGNLPCIGDKIICRQNNWDEMVSGGIYLINGLIGYIMNINDYDQSPSKASLIDFRPEFITDDNYFYDIPLDKEYIKTPIYTHAEFGLTDFNKFEYAYAISVHLSQGSQYDNVLYIDDFFHDRETTKKLRYTAISRAAKNITIVSTKFPPKQLFY